MSANDRGIWENCYNGIIMNWLWATAGDREDLGGCGLWTEERLASHICQISLVFLLFLLLFVLFSSYFI